MFLPHVFLQWGRMLHISHSISTKLPPVESRKGLASCSTRQLTNKYMNKNGTSIDD